LKPISPLLRKASKTPCSRDVQACLVACIRCQQGFYGCKGAWVMNMELEQRARRAVVIEDDAALSSRAFAALRASQFDVPALPAKLDPINAIALLDAAGQGPTLVLASIGYFMGRNRNPYQFARTVAGHFPQSRLILVQVPKVAITENQRQIARKYGAVDIAPSLAQTIDTTAWVEGLWFNACAATHAGLSPTSTQLLPVALGPVLLRALGARAHGWFTVGELLSSATREGIAAPQAQAEMESLIAQGALRTRNGATALDDATELSFFFADSVTHLFADSPGSEPASSIAGAIAQLDPNAVARAMQDRTTANALEILDRSFRFKQYPQCFVGSEAIDWLVGHYKLTRPQAVRLGEKIMATGLFRHVTDDQPFRDGYFFYRFEAQPGQPREIRDISTLDSRAVAAQMRGPTGVEIMDRRYRLTVYPQCFIGSQAVDWLCQRYGLTRPQALRLGAKLFDEGVFHHVVDEQVFEDTGYFYRFY
jgi:Domain found in Dishevelled, Egl-10, and Pleckstrin (DEP)